MSLFARIVCPVDFSEFSILAYRHALSLSEHYQAELFVLHCVEISRYSSAGFVPGTYFDDFRRHLLLIGEQEVAKLVGAVHGSAAKPQHAVLEGLAPDSIMAFAKDHDADLIVMGTHGRRGFDRLMLGSVTERVIRNASCPVLAVRAPVEEVADSKPAVQRDPTRLDRILFCTDFSESSQRALDFALSLTAEYGAELTLLHVLENISNPTRIAETMTTASQQLARLIRPEAPGAAGTKAIVRIGKPYEQIIRLAAESHADIVVMAVRGRSALDLAVFGSTTHRVIQLGPCPVLVVRV